MTAANHLLKRAVAGRALRSDRQSEQELPKYLALPIFASDPLSSVTYATQELLVVLSLGGWDRHRLDVPLTILDSPYREITRPVLEYVRGLRLSSPRDVVTVFIPEYVVGHWWETLLHDRGPFASRAGCCSNLGSW